MRYSFWILFICMLPITSCVKWHPPQRTHAAFSSCIESCVSHLEYCKRTCDNSCPTCSKNTTNQSIAYYQNYLHELFIRGGYSMRDLNSYRDPLQCRKVTCNCTADFAVCKQNCTGIIHKNLETQPYCS